MNMFRAFWNPEAAKATNDIASWFVSEAGRKAVNIAAAFTSCGFFGSYLFPHMFLLSKTKSILQLYKDGDPVELPKQLRQRAHQVLEETTLTRKEKDLMSFFTAFGFDVLHAGSPKLRGGAIIGIPISFNYRSTSDIDHNQLALLDHPDFSWKSRTGQRILTTLLMSNRAQQFAIAREIYYTSTHYVYTKGLTASACFLGAYAAGRAINQRLHLYQRPFKQRLGLYAILGTAASILFVLLKDMLVTSLEAYSDEKAADMGRDYVLGGLEYYECMIERNKALREAMGHNGEKYYTAGGNVRELIRISQVPLTARFDYMKQRLDDFTPEPPPPPPPAPRAHDYAGNKPPVTSTMDALAADPIDAKKMNKNLKL